MSVAIPIDMLNRRELILRCERQAREVDRLTRELADEKAEKAEHAKTFDTLEARIRELETDGKVIAELRRVTRERLGDVGAGMDMVNDIELAFVQLAERTRERDDALARIHGRPGCTVDAALRDAACATKWPPPKRPGILALIEAWSPSSDHTTLALQLDTNDRRELLAWDRDRGAEAKN